MSLHTKNEAWGWIRNVEIVKINYSHAKNGVVSTPKSRKTPWTLPTADLTHLNLLNLLTLLTHKGSNRSNPGPLTPLDDVAHLPHGIISHFSFSFPNLFLHARFRKGKMKQSTPGLCSGNPCVNLGTPISIPIAPLDSFQ
ncbi:hypothetical protein RHGRI_011765 [Rhododendron griersonianum]|uniref:Uncharacterized protein n=1 Tax=Rhododendron griersonianum TaxID=479676 RepID=A0AAV6KN73_9ERIC|nr:hypothetical protein RHGRI_011765 [Rhododendron griersonianum]